MKKRIIKKRTDAERRRRQAEKYARILLVDDMLKVTGDALSEEAILAVSEKLHVSTRTVWRDISAIRAARKLEIEL
jgi:hypothetical protein